ncbi:tRNA-binding protein [Maribacter hydrothermalis]|uniref:tRNA-binding protein n=1 Tax=Maribacter hydrothermalis TaxID=1836467 RepID=A0A1B7Z1L2_9FLAO|nr:tRNA-binding protein [Maribacter hydrothermalis]APQ18227.1 tRNA-binding protein [Maribacter hydrothermalis]OBR36574.1 tRNA-binding protein [Maribacter hydrothermalis]
MNETISWKDFSKIDMRTGTIVAVFEFPEARNPSYKLHIDFGEEIGTRKTSAQVTKNYEKKELIGLQVIAVINFPKKQIANFMSECLILGAVENDAVILIQPRMKVPNGLKIS